MIPLIQNNKQEIHDVCKKHHVKSLYVFGSALSEHDFNNNSDIDLLYEIDTDSFKDWDTGKYDYIDNLDDLQNNLSKLFMRKIDLIPYKNIHNSYFKQVVDNKRQLVYANR